jgi:hypothetical protein
MTATVTSSMKKLSPVLVVDEIEPCLPFWIDRLGFEKTTEVPEGSKLGFVILRKDDVEVMYQTRESVQKDVPALVPERGGRSIGLFIEVSDVGARGLRRDPAAAEDVLRDGRGGGARAWGEFRDLRATGDLRTATSRFRVPGSQFPVPGSQSSLART